MDEATAKVKDAIDDVFQTLLKNGVPKASVENMKKSIIINEGGGEDSSDRKENNDDIKNDMYISVLTSSQEHMKCYPYMDAHSFVNQLYNAWEALCVWNAECLNQARRKVMIMKADPKADPDALVAAETVRDEKQDACTKSNVGFYKIRALKSVYDKEENH